MENLGGASFIISANTASFDAGMAKAEASAKRAQKSIDGSISRVSASTKKMGDDLDKASSKSARGLLQLGYAVDDIQYGFRSIVNNIPQVFLGLGASAGVAGGAAIAAVAISQLIDRWGTLMSAFQSQWLNVPMSELEKLRLKAEHAAEAFQDLAKVPKAFDAKEIAALKHAMVEGGPDMVRKGIIESIMQEPGMAATRGEGLKRSFEHALNPMNMFKRKQTIEESMAEINQEKTAKLIGEALLAGEEGENARTTIHRLVLKYKKSFTDKFVREMEMASPENIRHMEELANRAANFVGPPFNRTHANRSAAAMMINSPLGREALMGGGEGGGGAGAAMTPPTEAQIRKGLKRDDIIKRAAQNMGVPYKKGQMEWVLKSPDIMKQAAGDLVKEQMANPPAAPAAKPKGKFDLHERMQAAMVADDIPGDAKGVIGEIQAMGRARVKQLMAERGVTEAQARAQMMRENIQHNLPGALTRGGQVLDPVAFSKMAHELIQGGPKDQQLAAMNQAVGYLKQLVDATKTPNPAIAVK